MMMMMVVFVCWSFYTTYKDFLVHSLHVWNKLLFKRRLSQCVVVFWFVWQKDFVILQFIGGCLVAQNNVAEIWSNAW